MKEKTVLQELFMQLKLQLGNNKVSQMFDEVYWLSKEQEQIEKAYESGYGEGCFQGSLIDHNESHKEYYQSKYGG